MQILNKSSMRSPIEVAIAKLETIRAFSTQNETLTKELQVVVNILENTVKQNDKEFMDSLNIKGGPVRIDESKSPSPSFQ